jgi:nucleoid DNA-binding protein
MYCRQHFTENYKKMYEIWGQHNPECRVYMDAKKLMNQKNFIMKHKKITEMEVEEIKRELQESQSSHLEVKEEEKLKHLGTIRDGEQEPNAAPATDEEMEIHQQRNQIYKLKEKIKSMCYQVTQKGINKRPRLHELQNMFKIIVIMKMANEAMEEILHGKYLNIIELNHLIYAQQQLLQKK